MFTGDSGIIRSILCCVLIGLGLSFNATAAEPNARGFYIGASLGGSELDDDGIFSGFGLSFDDSDTAFGIFGGYKILKYLAVEARFTDFGNFSVSNGVSTLGIEADALSAHVVGIVPFGASGWELFGQLGLGKVSLDADCSGCSDDETVGSAGLGVRWYVINNVALGLQVDVFAWEEDDGFQTHDIGVGATQFSIQYLF